MDGGYTYGTIQSGRGNVQCMIDGRWLSSSICTRKSKGQWFRFQRNEHTTIVVRIFQSVNWSRPTVPMGSNSYIPKLASADRISDEMKEKQIFYKLYAGVAFGRVDPVQNFNYVLSPNYSFPSPKVSVNHIHPFSVSISFAHWFADIFAFVHLLFDASGCFTGRGIVTRSWIVVSCTGALFAGICLSQIEEDMVQKGKDIR